ncbi:MAG: AIR synthase family protein [Anaerovoracaceae bacterium]
MKLETGKLDSELLKRLVFDKISYKSKEVKVRPGIGEDCAVVNFGDYDCIMSTDPITSSINDIGRLAIHITCNDIASNGVAPLGIMLAVMLPEGTSEEDVSHIMEQAAETAGSLNVEIIGGHTEITSAVKQPVIVSTAIGKSLSDKSQSGNHMDTGDFIMMTKSAGLEGAGIIACDYEKKLERNLTDNEIMRAKSFLNLVSVVKEGIAAGSVGTHGMHDITEGGVLGAVWEMCQIAHKGARVIKESIRIEPETQKICNKFEINPLRLISSGSMIIIVPKEKRYDMESAMKSAQVDFSIIGRIEDEDYGIKLISEDKMEDIEPPYADELYKVVGKKQD